MQGPTGGQRDEISISMRDLRRMAGFAAVGLLVVAAVFIAWQQRDRFTTAFDRGLGSQVDRTTYQVVFLDGGQVYFGKLSTRGDDYVLLDDVFYLPQQEPQSEANEGQLIKRGNELHGPREPMIIPIGQVLFIENLKPDAPVVSAIRKYHSGTPGSTAPPPTPRPATSRPATPSPTATR